MKIVGNNKKYMICNISTYYTIFKQKKKENLAKLSFWCFMLDFADR